MAKIIQNPRVDMEYSLRDLQRKSDRFKLVDLRFYGLIFEKNEHVQSQKMINAQYMCKKKP